jgi:enamine deaminase RidA (YjgF/YER057c/UK114 family)
VTPARALQPPRWRRASGYAHGVAASGTVVFISGQVGWNADYEFTASDLPGQLTIALQNVLTVLREAGGEAHHIARMTWYLVDRRDYAARRREIGIAYRSVMGNHFPAMSVVEVSGLLEEKALVEIEATAVIPA